MNELKCEILCSVTQLKEHTALAVQFNSLSFVKNSSSFCAVSGLNKIQHLLPGLTMYTVEPWTYTTLTDFAVSVVDFLVKTNKPTIFRFDLGMKSLWQKHKFLVVQYP